jgi:DNA repair photolyase
MHFKEAKSILSPRNGMNIYRGCSHGCIYCDSRSKCYNMAHDFEDIEVKINAPALLEDAIRRKRNRCMIGTGSMCDPYLHIEETLGLTRKCLEIIERFGFGAAVLTKSDRVLRDLNLLKRINKKARSVVQMTLTTYDERLCSILEPHVATSAQRFEALKILQENGIPTVIWLGPTLPFINDTQENLDGLLKYCVDAHVYGIICWGFGLTLREGNREYFYQKLDEHFPGLKEKYIRNYGNSYEVGSPNNEHLMKIFHETCEKSGIVTGNQELFKYIGTLDDSGQEEQLSLF